MAGNQVGNGLMAAGCLLMLIPMILGVLMILIVIVMAAFGGDGSTY